jgi:hypothetical protein
MLGELVGEGHGTCTICLGDYEIGDEVVGLPVCKHSFHSGCVGNWFEKNATCPSCRSPVKGPREVLQAEMLKRRTRRRRFFIGRKIIVCEL